MTEYGDLIDQTFVQPRQQARQDAISSIDDDPEQAARAIQLGDATGVHPNIVYGDVENFEKTHKSSLAAGLIENNPHLQDYINSHPLAAKVSNDDWGQLDKASEALGPFNDTTVLAGAKNFIEGFNKEMNRGRHGTWFLNQPGAREFAVANPYSFEAIAALGLPIELPMRLLNGVLEGAAVSTGRALKALPGSKDLGETIEEGGAEMAGMYFTGRMSGNIRPSHFTAHNAKLRAEAVNSFLDDMHELRDKIKPYTDAGEDIPIGLDPRIDKLYVDEARRDAKALAEADKEFQKSATLERSPDLMAEFTRLRADRNIGIRPDAVRELYGDKEPHPEDNILGHLEGFADKLREAEETGTDLEISLADWLAKVDPAVKKELKDDVRIRAGGITLNEAKELGEQRKAVETLAEEEPKGEEVVAPEPVEIVRQAAALDPLFEEGPVQQLKLKKLNTEMVKRFSGNEYQGHNFVIYNEKGASLGRLNLVERHEGLDLHIDWIGGYSDVLNSKGGVDNIFGPRLVRGLAKQLQAEFPKAEFISGDRVSGARAQAGKTGQVRIPLKTLTEEGPAGWDKVGGGGYEAMKSLKEILTQGEWTSFTPNVEGYIPTEKWTAKQEKAIAAVDEVLNRILPKGAGTQPVGGIVRTSERGKETNPRGMFVQYGDRVPIILFSVSEMGDPVATARHEAIHYLRRQGFFTPDEWNVLKEAAIKEDWIGKHGISDRYEGASASLQLEEAIADEFKRWKPKDETPIDKVFQKLAQLLKEIKAAISDVLGFTPTAEDIFKKVESGEVAQRQGTKPIDPRAFQAAEEGPAQGELAVTRQEDLAEFNAKALGMTLPRYKKYMKLIEQRNAEDIEAQTTRAVADEKRRQTKEWKANAAKIRAEVQPEMENKPDIAVGAFFRSGILYGEDTRRRPKLNPESLSEEQRKALPERYLSEHGVNADDVAGLFGFQSGEELAAKLIDFEKARGEQPYSKYLEKLVDAEVERRMQKEYGDLQQNILSEAQDHVLGDTQMDILHEQTVAMGMKAGTEMTFTRQDVQNWIKDKFAGMEVKGIKAQKFLDDAGRAGRTIEDSLLKEDFKEAFKQAQRQQYAVLLAKEAKKFEKEMAKFEKAAKRFSKREVERVSPENVNFIHDILMRIGRPVRRSVQDLQDSIAAGAHKDLASFYENRNLRGLPDEIAEYGVEYDPSMPVADFLFDPAYRKQVEEMTTEEFRAVNGSLIALAKQGREEFTINKQGEAFDLAEVKSGLIEQLKSLGEKPIPFNQGPVGKAVLFGKRMFAGLLQLEAIFDRFDRGDPRGTFTQFLSLPLIRAGNEYSTLQREFSTKVKDLEKYSTKLSQKIDNDVFYEPLSLAKDEEGKPIVPEGGTQWLPMTRANLRAVLLNVGNQSNMDKLARGYHTTPEAITDWLNKHSTKEDWDWAQAVGNIFGDIQKLADAMTMNLSGTMIEKVPLSRIEGKHGTYDGWYYPLIYDRTREGGPKGDMEAVPNIRAMTSRGFEKKRTGYAGPIDLSIEQMSDQISRRLKDVALRPALIEASKIFYDKEFKGAMTKYYGNHYTALLEPYLKDVAGQVGFQSSTVKAGERFVEGLRQNVIGVLIGWNPGTVMKHGPTALVNSITEVGPANFARATYDLFKTNDITSDRNYHFIRHGGQVGDLDWKGSAEVNRRMQHWEETIGGAQDIALGKLTLRQTMLKYGSKPVAWSDMASVLPTWLAKYREVMDEVGGTKSIEEAHTEAVDLADRAVRRAHGSTAITSRPELVRSGPMGRTMTSLYGFFNHVFQRYYRMSWQAKDLAKGEAPDTAKGLQDLSIQFFSYVVIPTLIEEAVTPLTNDKKESILSAGSKMLAKTLSSSVPVIRDIVHAVLTGHDPSTGVLQTGYKAITDMARDLPKGFTRQNTANMIQHSITLNGVATGLGSAQLGKWAKFGLNYTQGAEKPKTGGDWYRVFRHGTSKEIKQR